MGHKATVWYLYVVRTVDNTLYAGIATDVARRYREHCSGGSRCARYLRGHPPAALVFSTKVGSHSRALTVEYRFKRLSKAEKERAVQRQHLDMRALTVRGRHPDGG